MSTRPQLTADDYARAEARLAPNLQKAVPPVHVRPWWFAGGEAFWFERRSRTGGEFLVVRPALGTIEPAFDHAALARDGSAATDETWDAADLGLSALRFSDDGALLGFTRRGKVFTADGRPDPTSPPAWVLASPDGRRQLYREDDDLWVRPAGSEEGRRLTFDGEAERSWGKSPDANNRTISDRRMGIRPAPLGSWSPDSRRVLTHRLDERGVEMLHLVQTTPPQGVRPVLHSYRVPFPGDEHTARAELHLIDLDSGGVLAVDHPPLTSIVATPFERGYVWWSADSRRAWVIAPGRGDRRLDLIEIDAATGAARVVISETGESYVEAQPQLGGQPNVGVLGDGAEVLWWSERDGFGHLYLYDGATGALKRQVTSGPWMVRELLHVDEAARMIWFTAGGREPGRDPYYRCLYRVGLDGGEIELLTPEHADHHVTVPAVRMMFSPEPSRPGGSQSLSPNGRWFVDTWSRIDTAPVCALRDAATGAVLRELATFDTAALEEVGWRWPEPVETIARDGVTPIYGAIFRPSTFDPSRRYPVIDVVYPGPHTIRTPKSSFGGDPNAIFMYYSSQALAELGFIVVAMDGMGTAFRSKAFHDVSTGRLQDCGLPDHVTGLQQLAARYPELDLERVGIWGYSAGGFMAARALLDYPEFYKVGVSSAGNHDSRAYHAAWGEKYHGRPGEADWDAQVTAHRASRLKGKLLITVGELDDNAHPAMAYQLTAALIAANRDFDFLALPNMNHAYGIFSGYYIRRVWDYFVRHLSGAEPPRGYRVADLDPSGLSY